MATSYDVIVGIDPDSGRDGVAVLRPSTREITVRQTIFGETIKILQQLQIQCMSQQQKLMVVIEAGWLNKGNWHVSPKDTKFSAARKGVDQGRNHQRGLDIVEFCKFNRIPYTEVKPLQKGASGFHFWNGADGKITQEEITTFMGDIGRCNQEGRDAALLAWTYAGLPICTNKALMDDLTNKTTK